MPRYAYVSHTATDLKASLETMNITVRYYGDVNIDGTITFADLKALLLHFAQKGELADQYTADLDNSSDVSLKDVSLLFKMFR